MNTVGFATTFSLVDLLDELPLPKALNLKDHNNLATENVDLQNLQELHNVASVIAPAIHMARLPSDLDRLRFRNSSDAPTPGVRTHFAQASPLMALIVNHHQQFNDIITVPPYRTPVIAPSPSHQVACPPQPAQVAYPPQPQALIPTQPAPIAPQAPIPSHQPLPPQQHQHPPQPLPLQQQQQHLQPPISPQVGYQQHPQQHHVPYTPHQPQPPPAAHAPQQAHMAHIPPPQVVYPPQPQIPLRPEPQLQLQPPQIVSQQAHLQPQLQQQHPQQQQQQHHHHHQQPQQSRISHQTQSRTSSQHSKSGHHHHHHQHQQQQQQQHHLQNQHHHNHHHNQTQVVQPSPKRNKIEHKQKKAIRAEISIDSRDSTIEEILEKFLQDLVSEQMGSTLFNFSPKQLLYLVAITAKLKKKNRTKNVNLNKLTLLMTTLSSQLQVQTEVLKTEAHADNGDSGDESDQNGTSDQTKMQKFETCCDCAVTALNIMTSNGMDSRVYLEECVEAIINFINIALTIITDTSTRNFCSSPKKSSKHSGDRRASKRLVFTKQSLSKLNAKCSEVLALVNDLLVCRTEATLTDSLLLSTSRAALTAFFLMDTSTSSNELQLNALNIITAIFASYKNHQTVILDELIYSIARLPTTKRNRVPYQIGSNNSESISIFSALIMKLIQSLFTIRKNALTEERAQTASQTENPSDANDYERVLKSQYNSALRASYAFVSSFLRRCCGVDKKDDCDYRVLFETFVEDHMTCLYKPDWSSAQLITHVLIKLLISNINPQPGKKNQQSTNQTLKLASLEHLGTICARLVKEKSTLLRCKREVKKALKAIDLSSLFITEGNDFKSKRLRIKSIKKDLLSDSDSDGDTEADGEHDRASDINDMEEYSDLNQQKILSRADEQKFWLALLTFCQREKGVTKCGRNIFCAIWLKEIERRAKNEYELNNPTSMNDGSISDDDESNGASQSFAGNNIRQYSRSTNEENQPATNGPSVEDIQAGLAQDFFKLLTLSARKFHSKSRDTSEHETTDEDSTIDETTASNIIKILDVSLPTTQKLIDASLSHIVAALSSTANTNIRSRAMKSLSHVLNDAPKDCAAKLLARDDLQKAIGSSLLDQSTSVRESTVELIGRFILNSQSEELIDKYYDMLTNRIMDSGVSVRKRVIKILREICITYPAYPRVPEICSIIIKRINDEGEGIRKLVSETFTQMWFKEERTHEAIVAKVACITHVVATVWSKILAEANKSTGAESHFEWLHQLLSSLLKVKTNTDEQQANHVAKRRPRASESEAAKDEDGETIPPEVVNVKQTLAASTQIIAVLMSEKLSNGSQESTSRADCLAAMTALWSFAKISPLLLVQYLELFQSFLNVEPKSSFDLLILEKVIQIIELILPSISNPSSTTMNNIEANLSKLIIRGSIRVINVSVSCLSELIHRHTRNYQLSNDMFHRFLRIIRSYRANQNSFEANQQAYFLRALYTCGLLAKHFNFEDRDILYAELVHFVQIGIRQMQGAYHNSMDINHRVQDERILLKSLEGLGFMFERSPSLMLKESTTQIYRYFMGKAIDAGPGNSAIASICVITNLRNYLQDEVSQEIKSASSIDWSRENLKEMTSSKQEDANSTQSSVIQLYLRDMLSCALSSNGEIRKASIKLIHSVHNGGHINPLSIVPSLIALSSDDDSSIRVRADHILQEIERKYNNFVNMKSKQGVLESFILNRGKRGFHRLDTDKPQATQSDVQSSEQSADTNSSSNHNDNHNVNITAKLSNLYSIVATNRQQRRAFINALLRYFDLQTLASAPNMLSNDQAESRFVLSKCIGSDILLFVCDNIMFLPFTLLDEPFFLIHQIGITMSNLVSQAVSQFREILQLSSIEDEEVEDEDNIEINDDELSGDSTEAEVTDEEEDPENRKQRKLLEKQSRLRQRKLELRQRKLQQKCLEQNLTNAIEAQDNNNEIDDLPVSILRVRELVSSLHRCILLMHCKRVIWDLYGITEQKFEDYTPNESTKVTDKPTHRKSLDEQTYENLIKMPQTTVHFDSEPYMRSMYSSIFGFEDSQEMINELEQCAPNRHKLKLEYKRFSQLMTK